MKMLVEGMGSLHSVSREMASLPFGALAIGASGRKDHEFQRALFQAGNSATLEEATRMLSRYLGIRMRGRL